LESYRQQQVRAYFALLEIGELLRHLIEEQLRRDGNVSYVQFRILAELLERGGSARMTDLADLLVFSQAGLTYRASQLETAGLIVRRRAEKDQRTIEVTLSDQGSALMSAVLPASTTSLRAQETTCVHSHPAPPDPVTTKPRQSRPEPHPSHQHRSQTRVSDTYARDPSTAVREALAGADRRGSDSLHRRWPV
jgi:DNA-binding MarR family transcriptional regulator